jgi:tetratricopeptide (TPR) repeat protein
MHDPLSIVLGFFRNPWGRLIFVLVIAGILVISPVSAEYGYTQKWMGSPAWLQEKSGGSTFQPKLFKGAELAISLSQFTANYINAGKDYLIAGSYNDAKISFDNAIGRNSESFDAWLGRAWSLESLRRYQSSVESYDNAIKYSKSNKNSYIAYAGKGRSSLEIHKFQDANDAFDHAIVAYQSSPANNLTELIYLYEGLADAKENLGQKPEADEARKKAEDIRSKGNS